MERGKTSGLGERLREAVGRARPFAWAAMSAIASSASGSPRLPASVAKRMIVASRTNCAALTPRRVDSRSSIAHRSSPNRTVVAFIPTPEG